MSATAESLRVKIRSVTSEMGACVAKGDWLQAGDLGALRLDLLEALFACTSDPAQEIVLIEQILDADRTLKVIAEENRDRVAEEMSQHRRRGEAARRYLEAASLDT